MSPILHHDQAKDSPPTPSACSRPLSPQPAAPARATEKANLGPRHREGSIYQLPPGRIMRVQVSHSVTLHCLAGSYLR